MEGCEIKTEHEIREADEVRDAFTQEMTRLKHKLRLQTNITRKECLKAGHLVATYEELLSSLQVATSTTLRVSPEFTHTKIAGHFWVSIAAWGAAGCFCCDYADVYYLNRTSGKLIQLPNPVPREDWHPTGLACIRDEDTVFVANYLGHDVFEFAFAEGRLELKHRYSCEGIMIPEGVAVSRDGSLVAVADYEGNQLWVFQRQGELAWQAEVGLAHGVAFGPDCVYVTSLMDKCIIRFDLLGHEDARVGRMGWGGGEFIWPTCVFADAEGVIVSDAHTGKITRLEHDLTVIDTFGGNGVGTGLFNMPYFAIRDGSEYWICDTFKRRILHASHDAGVMREFSACAPVASANHLPDQVSIRWNYTDLSTRICGPDLHLPEGVIFPGYGRLVHFDSAMGAWRPLSLQMDPQSLWSPGMPTYFCWVHHIQRFGTSLVAIGAVNHPGIFLVDASGRCCVENRTGRAPLQYCGGRAYEADGAILDLAPVTDAAQFQMRRSPG